MRTATSTRAVVTAAAVAALLSVIVSVGSASAVTLRGEWAPFNRCPVDNATMLATNAEEGNASICLAVNSKSGSLKLGNLSLKLGQTDTQMGVFGRESEFLFLPIPQDGSTIVTSPIEIPGGLAGLVCPKGQDFKGDICKTSRPARLNRVTATLESAGTATNFSLFGALTLGERTMTLPIRVHLQNPLLGPNCYVGSKTHPILVEPTTVKIPEAVIQSFEFDGTVPPEGVTGGMFETVFVNGSQTDTQFTVPAATGCGFAGQITAAINHKVGLPSPAGINGIVLNEASSFLAGLYVQTATDGKDLSKYWHEAVIG